MMQYDEYLGKKIRVYCKDSSEFYGDAVSFGGTVQGEEEYGRAESFIVVYTGDGEYVLFESEIEAIK